MCRDLRVKRGVNNAKVTSLDLRERACWKNTSRVHCTVSHQPNTSHICSHIQSLRGLFELRPNVKITKLQKRVSPEYPREMRRKSKTASDTK